MSNRTNSYRVILTDNCIFLLNDKQTVYYVEIQDGQVLPYTCPRIKPIWFMQKNMSGKMFFMMK